MCDNMKILGTAGIQKSVSSCAARKTVTRNVYYGQKYLLILKKVIL